MDAEILELNTRTRHQILHCPRHEHVIGAPDMRNARGDVHRDPAHVVHANAHWNVKPTQRVANGARAVDCPLHEDYGSAALLAHSFGDARLPPLLEDVEIATVAEPLADFA
jgi:hypothetical protein